MSKPINKDDLKLTTWDAANYLETPQEWGAYLNIYLEREDFSLPDFLEALNTVTRSMNRKKLAEKAGVSRAGLYHALSDKGNPSFLTMMKIFDTLGLNVTLAKSDAESTTV